MSRTSVFSRMKHKAEAADFNGGNASADSLTPRSVNLAAEDARDLKLGLFLAALWFVISSEEFVRFLFPFLRTDRIRLPGSTLRSELQERERLNESSGIIQSAYRWALDHPKTVSGGRKFARSRDRSQDLELIRWDAERLNQLPSGLGLGRPRSWLRFALYDGFLVRR